MNPTASVSTAWFGGLDFGCLSAHFEHLYDPFCSSIRAKDSVQKVVPHK
jgi:hypothetical protein